MKPRNDNAGFVAQRVLSPSFGLIAMIERTIHNYRIVSELGKGDTGVVYLAEHINLPRRFVVKCLTPALTQAPEFLERFYQEAQNQAMLDHPAIVQATDYFEDGGQFLLVKLN